MSSSPSSSSLLPWAEPAWHHSLDSPYYNATHRTLQSFARSYLNRHILPHALHWEAAGDCPDAAKDAYLASGLATAGLDLPQQQQLAGISQLDVFHLLVLVDETARIEGGVGIALCRGANAIGLPPILHHGTAAQKQRWVPGICSPVAQERTSFCLGVTEASGGSDVRGAIRTRAVLSEDDNNGGACFVVTGTKKWITGSQWATHMTTAVRTTNRAGEDQGGISLLVIPLRDTPGVEIEKIPCSGQNAGGASWVRLDKVRVPVDNLVGREGRGFEYLMTNFNKERFIMAVACNRKARTCLTTAMEYASVRETFGRPLAARQGIRTKLVALAREVEGHWAWLEQIAWHVQQRGWQTDSVAGRIALVKVAGGRILEMAAREAQQVMGGVAYQKGGPGGGGIVEQITRDLRMMVVGGGSEEILGELAWKEELKAARKRAEAKI